jgi:hypothetical protein
LRKPKGSNVATSKQLVVLAAQCVRQEILVANTK